jgi:UDP-N-acetylglucosamine 3-dehydrogenase
LESNIRIGVIGAGYWGSKIAQEYSSIEETTGQISLAYVADFSEEAIKSIRTKLNRLDTKFVTDYNEVITGDQVDAVHLAIPNELHYDVANLALKSGKHVLLEKPMATSSRAAFKLARLADEKRLVLRVGHIFRFNNSLRIVKKIIQSGMLGKLFYANLVWVADQEPPRDRDIVFDLAPHPIDVLNYLLEEWPLTVDAIGQSYVRKKPNQEEMSFINLQFPDDVLVNVFVSWIQHGAKDRSVNLVFERGALNCDALNQTVTISVKNGEHLNIPEDISVSKQVDPRILNVEVIPNNTIRDMELHFIENIRGRGPQYNSALIGAETVRVLESITEKMRVRQGTEQNKLQFKALITQ